MYYTDCKPKNRNKGGLGTGLVGVVCIFQYHVCTCVQIYDKPAGSEASVSSHALGGGEGTMASDPGDHRFSSLKDVASEKTLKAIAEMGFTDMMEIQHRCIRPLLEGRYV